MQRFACLLLLLIALPTAVLAVVRPPEEWFAQPGHEQLWQQMWPTLQDWEFGPQPQLLGSHADSIVGIEQHLGESAKDVALQMGRDPFGPAALKYDLNRDGTVDQFDVLELGYEARPAAKQASIAPPTGTNQWIVLRVDFADDQCTGTYNVAYFNQRFFSDGTAPKPSVNDYYQEVSYGALSIQGGIADSGPGWDGWFRADHNKQWYIDNGGGYLVMEAVEAADSEIDFSDYDVDGDGYVDTVIVFYPNATFSGGLWPHRSSGLNIHVDGVIADSYFLTGYSSNDSWTMTISSHEYGHILGLPDLYDVDYSSNGVGVWSLMAYQYDNDQKIPSPDPWCKIKLGWLTPAIISDNVSGYSMQDYQTHQEVAKVWTNGQREDQYFLIANYRKTGTDANRPGAGLLVEHIDDSRTGNDNDNSNEFRKHVDIESARGFEDPDIQNVQDPLDKRTDTGHANDLFFSGNSAAAYTGVFDDTTSNPFARKYPYPYSNTYCKLSNISAAGATMTLDIEVVSPTAPSCVIDSPTGGTFSGNITVDVTATPADGRTLSRVEFYCNEAYFGQDTAAPYSLTFDSRSVYTGDREIRAVAVDDQGSIDTDTATVTLDNSAVSFPYSDGFESGVGGWASYNPSGIRRWQSFNIAYAGTKSAGIGSTTNGYGYDEHDEFVSAKIDLAGTAHPIVRYKQRYRVSGGENTCKVFVTSDEGVTKTLLGTWTGTNLAWHPAALDLLDYVGSEVRLIFKLDSSSLNNMTGEAGWWIDALEVKEQSAAPEITGITPDEGSNLGGIETITVTATDDEGVSAVEFKVDGDDLIYTDYASPFTFDWNSDWVFNGSHTFTAVAYDADLLSDSALVNWTTDNSGLSLPYNEGFATDPGNIWRITNDNGSGYWHRLATGGYGGGAGMYLGTTNAYDNNEYDMLLSPTIDLGAIDNPSFAFLHKYDVEVGYDYAYVFITTDLTNWTQLGVFNARNQPWQPQGYHLDSYANEKVKLAYLFTSDGGLTYTGWWADEVRAAGAPHITSVTPNPVPQTRKLTINGSGFGTNPANDFASVTLGGTSEAVVSWNDTQIVVTVSASTPLGADKPLIVTRRGVTSNTVNVQVNPPPLPPPDLTGLGQN